MSLQLTVLDMANSDEPFEGAAVYVWHCDAAGGYSMYSDGIEEETYLRGVQVADAKARVTTPRSSPPATPGRWPHIHFEVYPDVDSISDSTNAIATSQIALPEDVVTPSTPSLRTTGRREPRSGQPRQRQRLQRRQRRPAARGRDRRREFGVPGGSHRPRRHEHDADRRRRAPAAAAALRPRAAPGALPPPHPDLASARSHLLRKKAPMGLLHNLTGWHALIILAVILLLFGAAKLRPWRGASASR